MKNINEIYSLVIESLLLEAVSLEEIWKKFYKNEVKDFNIFIKLNKIDPSGTDNKKGKYLDWLVRKAYKNNPKTIIEDASKIKEDLELFDKYQVKIGKQITQVKDYYELSKLVGEFRKKKDAGEIDLSRSEIKKDADKIFEDANWLILSPKTEAAAKYYGKNTRWCTSAEENNVFDEYNLRGPLYILINKKVPSEKYQFHFQSNQYMDSEDIDIDFRKIILPNIIYDKLMELAKKNNEKNTGVMRFIVKLPTSLQRKYLKQYPSDAMSSYKDVMYINKYAKNKDFIRVRDIIEKNDYSSIRADNLVSVLYYAITYDNLDFVKYLIEEKKLYMDIHNGLRLAAQHGNLDIINYFISKGAYIDYVDLTRSDIDEKIKIYLQKLIDSGVNSEDNPTYLKYLKDMGY